MVDRGGGERETRPQARKRGAPATTRRPHWPAHRATPRTAPPWTALARGRAASSPARKETRGRASTGGRGTARRQPHHHLKKNASHILVTRGLYWGMGEEGTEIRTRPVDGKRQHAAPTRRRLPPPGRLSPQPPVADGGLRTAATPHARPRPPAPVGRPAARRRLDAAADPPAPRVAVAARPAGRGAPIGWSVHASAVLPVPCPSPPNRHTLFSANIVETGRSTSPATCCCLPMPLHEWKPPLRRPRVTPSPPFCWFFSC